MNIAQNIMTHFVLFKRKFVMDQLRKGMELMGVLDQIKNHPDFYSELLTAKATFTAIQLIDILCFEDDPPSVCVDNLKRFLNQADVKTLTNVVRYITGSIYLPRKKHFSYIYQKKWVFCVDLFFKIRLSDCGIIQRLFELTFISYFTFKSTFYLCLIDLNNP